MANSSKIGIMARYSGVSRFLENAREIFETAERVLETGGTPSNVSILMGGSGGIRIIAESDWPLESLQREHGAAMAYRVSGGADRVRVEGRNGPRTCHLETIAPAQIAKMLLNAAPCCYTVV